MTSGSWRARGCRFSINSRSRAEEWLGCFRAPSLSTLASAIAVGGVQEPTVATSCPQRCRLAREGASTPVTANFATCHLRIRFFVWRRRRATHAIDLLIFQEFGAGALVGNTGPVLQRRHHLLRFGLKRLPPGCRPHRNGPSIPAFDEASYRTGPGIGGSLPVPRSAVTGGSFMQP